MLLDQWTVLIGLRRSVLKTPDLGSIHDLRVASRRFRAMLDLFNPLVHRESKNRLAKGVRKLTRILGGLRNVDEATSFFRPRLGADFPFSAKLDNCLFELRSMEFERVEKVLIAFDQNGYSRAVRKIIADMKVEGKKRRSRVFLFGCFSEASIRLYLPIQLSMAGSTVTERHELRHSLRIAIKKWRYFMEIVARVFNSDCPEGLELAKEYQSLLGRMNDIVEFDLLLTKMGFSGEEQDRLKTILRMENDELLKKFTVLIEQKPLTYRFPIHPEVC